MGTLDNSEITRVSGGRFMEYIFGGLIAIGSAMAIVGAPEISIPTLLGGYLMGGAGGGLLGMGLGEEFGRDF